MRLQRLRRRFTPGQRRRRIRKWQRRGAHAMVSRYFGHWWLSMRVVVRSQFHKHVDITITRAEGDLDLDWMTGEPVSYTADGIGLVKQAIRLALLTRKGEWFLDPGPTGLVAP